MSDPITLLAPAKINLLLRVLSRESDGYHGIETLFARISLADELVLEPRDPGVVALTIEGGMDLGPEEDNLVTRAMRLVLDATRHPVGVHCTLRKRIPVQAGLGGGSADAAAALLGTNALAGHRIPPSELLQLAARLGADVPFCLTGAPLALAWGHGERLLRLPPLPPTPLLVLTPPAGIPTSQGYAWVDAAQGPSRRGALALDLEALGSWGSVARMAGNDFESPTFAHLPAARAAFEALVATHPFLCRMTGSGSSLVALYRSPREREDARHQLGRKFGTVREADTL